MFNKFRHNKETAQPAPESSPIDERMLTSENEDVRFILRHLSPERINEISNFVNKYKEQNFTENPDLEDYNQELHETLTNEERETLKGYTGYMDYKGINSVERGIWNYDELGQKTPEKEARFRQASATITKAIQKSPRTSCNFKTYRGTNLDSFRGYNIEDINDLKGLEGQLFYEQGFASSSMSKETSFYDKEFEDTYRKTCNVEIEYLVPGGSHDGVALMDDSAVSYSKNQKEYLFDKNSLYAVLDVQTNQSSAKITKLLIPKELWTK